MTRYFRPPSAFRPVITQMASAWGTLSLLVLLTGCEHLTKAKAFLTENPAPEASPLPLSPENSLLTHSIVSSSLASVSAGFGFTAYLRVRDANDQLVGRGGQTVTFSCPQATCTIGAVTDNLDGTYQATFSAVRSASNLEIQAAIGGSPVINTASVIVNPVPFTQIWPFDALTESLYTFDPSTIQLRAGVVELIGTDHSESDTGSSGFSMGTFAGVALGTLADGSNTGLKLDSSGTPTNLAELDASWTPQWESLVSYWKLNNNFLDSKGSNHGSIVSGTSVFSTDAKLGSHSHGFTAGGYISAGTDPSLNFGIGEFSFASWTRSTATMYSGIGGKLNGCNSANSAWSLSIRPEAGGTYNATGRPYFESRDSAGTSTVISANHGVQDSTWHHVVVTRSGATINIFVDGLLSTSATTPTVVDYTNSYPFSLEFGNCNTSQGQYDDMAIWSKALTASDIQTLYSRQSARYAGTFTSRVIDLGEGASWNGLSWSPSLPYQKELPDATCGSPPCAHNHPESSADYVALVGSTGSTSDSTISTTGLIGLWHMDESSWNGTTGEAKDDSGQGNHATAASTLSTVPNGLFSRAGSFGHVSNTYLTTGDTTQLNPTVALTTSAWIKPDANINTAILFKGPLTNYQGDFAIWIKYTKDFNCILNNTFLARGYTYTEGTWHHVACTYDGSFSRLYVNGVLVNSVAYSSGLTSSNSPLTLGEGYSSVGQHTYRGLMDEVAIWSRALHADEIKQLYQRGGSRLKYQVRSCATNPCTAESWRGPDGTNQSYFSELNNNSVPLDSSGDTKASLPSLLFTDYLSPPPGNLYFQYRAIFETDSSTIALGPELRSVTAAAIQYPVYTDGDTSPANTLIGKQGVAYYDLTHFVESLGSGGCSSGVVYNLGLSTTGPWKYWTGAAWENSNGSATQANSAAALSAASNAALASFGSSVGRGTVFFKAYLRSSGMSQCELDGVRIDVNQ